MCLKSDGTQWAWGQNQFGQLADGDTLDQIIPVHIGVDLDIWMNLSGGYAHSLAVKSNGSLWAWGFNLYGQLGDSTTKDKRSLTQIGKEHTWVSISAFLYHSMGLKSNGTMWTWGNNSSGQLGDGTKTDKYKPIQIGTDNDWVSISAGGTHCIALKSNGSIWSWGTICGLNIPIAIWTATTYFPSPDSYRDYSTDWY